MAVAAVAATSLADSVGTAATTSRPGVPLPGPPCVRPGDGDHRHVAQQHRRRAAAVGVGHHEAHPVTHLQQVDDGRVGDPERDRGGPGVAAQQPARHRARPGHHLPARHRCRERPADHLVHGRPPHRRGRCPGSTASRSGRPLRRTVPLGRSRRAVHTVTVSGGAGATAWSPTSTAPATVSAASGRRCSSTRRWSRRRERSTGRSGFMAPKVGRTAPACAGNPQGWIRWVAQAGAGAEELEVPEELVSGLAALARALSEPLSEPLPEPPSEPLESLEPVARRSPRSRTGLGLLGAAVGAVEAGALEHDTHGVEHLAQPTLALGAHREGVVGEALHDLEEVAAVVAGVLIRGH